MKKIPKSLPCCACLEDIFWIWNGEIPIYDFPNKKIHGSSVAVQLFTIFLWAYTTILSLAHVAKMRHAAAENPHTFASVPFIKV